MVADNISFARPDLYIIVLFRFFYWDFSELIRDNFYMSISIIVLESIMADLPIAAVTRVAKNAGAERVGADASEILVQKTEEFLGELVREAVKLANHAGRKTIKEEDIEMAAEKFA
jgi:histone H3/H4